jgi:hemoglobin-like flavoprotein
MADRRTMMMTADQRRLVRETVGSLRDQAGPFSLLFYGRLFELDPTARRLFHNDLVLQGRKVISTLDSMAESLDRFESMRARLAELGRQHAGYGVRPDQYESVVAALLWAIAQALGPDFDIATRDAWKLALSAVSDAMKDGASGP